MYVWKLLIVMTFAAIPLTLAAQTPVQTPQIVADDDPDLSHWFASAVVGSNFGDDADEASLEYGGSIGWLWDGVIGGEFAASFSPDFQFEPSRSALLGGTEPWVNSYMANVIGALPFAAGRFQPYVSGGLGALTLRSDVIGIDTDNPFDADGTQFGGNIGGGVMAYGGALGFRGDIRFFRGFEEDLEFDGLDPGEEVGSQVLSDLGYWRANVGLAIRF